MKPRKLERQNKKEGDDDRKAYLNSYNIIVNKNATLFWFL